MERDDDTIRVQLARMEGKLDVSNERLSGVQTDVTELKTRVHKHGNEIQIIRSEMTGLANHNQRITVLETARSVGDGERKGIAHSGRALWALIGLLMTAIGAGLLRHFGV